jgi:hypothetical protein
VSKLTSARRPVSVHGRWHCSRSFCLRRRLGQVSSFVGVRLRVLAGCGGRAVVGGRWRWASCRACHSPRRWVVVTVLRLPHSHTRDVLVITYLQLESAR